MMVRQIIYTLSMIAIAIVGGTMIFVLSQAFFDNYTPPELNELKKAEASSKMIFDVTTVFYDTTDSRKTIHTQWEANGGTKLQNGSHSYLQFIRLNDLDVLAVSWWQNIDGKFIGTTYDCGQNVICFNSKNETVFMVIQILDDSIEINEELTLKQYSRILDIKDFDAGYDEPTKLVTVGIDGLDDYEGRVLPQFTLFFATEFNDKCIFAIDYVTCEMNQELINELQKLREQ